MAKKKTKKAKAKKVAKAKKTVGKKPQYGTQPLTKLFTMRVSATELSTIIKKGGSSAVRKAMGLKH